MLRALMLLCLAVLAGCADQGGLGHRSYYLTDVIEVKAPEVSLAIDDSDL